MSQRPTSSLAVSARVADRYQLLELIGEGGMGVVWRGLDLDLEEPVAIKFLRDELAQDDRLRACFRREVKLARRVTHPNVARVNEFGHDGALYFLTMEFIDGEVLSSTLAREGFLPLEAAGRLALGLCRGLAAAHAAGVVHGDVKPGNIMLTPERGAVVTDFGIAQVLSEVQGKEDAGVGTPIYMAPEQFTGGAITLRTDVYAVGVVLLEALTGRLPWPSDDLVTLLEHKCSGRDPELRFATHLAPEWIALVADCLHTDPQRRPADARALLSRLTGLPGLTDVPVRLRRPPSTPVGSVEGPKWVEIALFGVEDALVDESAEWVAGELVDALSQVRGLRVVAGGPSSGELPPDGRTRIRGEVRPDGDGMRVALEVIDAGKPQEKIEVHRPGTNLHGLGSAIAERIVATLHPLAPAVEVAPVEIDPETAGLYFQARIAFRTHRSGEALARYEEALARAPEHPHVRLGHALVLMRARLVAREPSDAEITDLHARAERSLAELGNLGESHWLMACVLLTVNAPVQAASCLREAVARAPALAPALALLGDLLLEIGRHPDAERRLNIVLALDPDNLVCWILWAKLLAYLNRWDEFDALLCGKLVECHARGVHVLRWMLWHPQPEVFQRLEPVLADNLDGLPQAELEEARDVLAFALDRGARSDVFQRIVARRAEPRNTRHGRFYAQMLCEMACILGDLDRAREQLRIADRFSLIDWHWIEECGALAPLRSDPVFAEVRARVRARADSVAEAIWD